MNLRALLVLLVLGATWGASFLFIKVVVEETSPLVLVEGRLLLGAVVVLAVMALRNVSLRASRGLWAKVAVMAVISNIIPFLLISWGEIHIESGTASVLNSTMPLFTVLFSAIFLAEEQLTVGKVAGLLVGFLGVFVLTGADIVDVSDSNVLGELAVVGAAVCYGIGAVYARVLLRSEEALSLSGLQLLAAAVILAPFLPVNGTPDLRLSTEAWLSLLPLGVLGTGVGYVAYLWLLEQVGAVRASLVTYVVPVTGLLLGWAVLDEPVGVNTIAGCALIIAGIAVVVRGRGPEPTARPAATKAGGLKAVPLDPAD
ncbi:MAG: DMT family transporter [Chloroflexi bacterium]|nr:DMT family transporter [Chloroflexota bacterium]